APQEAHERTPCHRRASHRSSRPTAAQASGRSRAAPPLRVPGPHRRGGERARPATLPPRRRRARSGHAAPRAPGPHRRVGKQARLGPATAARTEATQPRRRAGAPRHPASMPAVGRCRGPHRRHHIGAEERAPGPRCFHSGEWRAVAWAQRLARGRRKGGEGGRNMKSGVRGKNDISPLFSFFLNQK
ncbi:hypothetical protein BS78_03G025600, partial [Paspalum vaginatum]